MTSRDFAHGVAAVNCLGAGLLWPRSREVTSLGFRSWLEGGQRQVQLQLQAADDADERGRTRTNATAMKTAAADDADERGSLRGHAAIRFPDNIDQLNLSVSPVLIRG